MKQLVNSELSPVRLNNRLSSTQFQFLIRKVSLRYSICFSFSTFIPKLAYRQINRPIR
jgi:hypothetical protein